MGAELDRGPSEVLVTVSGRHPCGAGTVRLACDRACDGRVLDLADDDGLLPGLDVRADSDRELRVTTEALVGVDERVGGEAHRRP